ncbi:hypothetical protein SLEP1_g18550 [Rubroshorea leprosula]|uniref:PB1 domain-containing protein n=1 Tax=Rubroshorea leprosula TaxID=152421 RepID=A0AAV5IXX6_9ROSI|nr:hypothetical protein SLEP1_g18550 [Rubroshorea leprosula]
MKNLDFDANKVLAKEFLSNFTDQEVANCKIRAIQIDLEDLDNYKDKDEEFFRWITENTRRYIGIFASVVDELLPAPTEDIPDDIPILMTQRADNGNGIENADATNPLKKMPPEIKRYYKLKENPFSLYSVPRPHDNQLRYVGGDTRIVALSRSITFMGFLSKLSKLSGISNVNVKYQLPNEDLDALISITTDEELENMMDEYDRLAQNQNRSRPGSGCFCSLKGTIHEPVASGHEPKLLGSSGGKRKKEKSWRKEKPGKKTRVYK